MQPNISKKWYQKKRYIIPLGVFVLFILIGLFGQNPANQNTGVNSSNQNQQQVKNETITIPAHQQPLNVIQQQPTTQSQPQATPPQQPQPSYYINSSGNTVQSPTKTQDNSVPAGATARCRDGSYSFSQHRSGTCSHHGGVANWLN
jgi:hypothetical protein